MHALNPIPCLSAWTVALALLLPLSPAPAFAAASDNCRLQISNPVVDYGNVTRPELMKRQISPLQMSVGKQSVTLTAVCRQPVFMSLFFRGNAADNMSYRFGNAGSFLLTVSSAQLDGKAINLGRIKVAGQNPESVSSSAPLFPNEGVIAVINELPARGSNLSLQVHIEARIPTTTNRITDQTIWRGNGTFELMEN
ncbi:hypothetical protein [Herbaspirillum rhizosphaerae]|uniref:hypothetical protein n=1 Tax=Herbaspirillum rhizosphaerae TaxID=346179 RepID=UPI0012ED8E60|nr:hypothetical protein [Herbaspirillum rhizosphaerae]